MARRKSANTVALLASLLTPLGISGFAPAPAAPLAQASSEQPSAPAARSGGVSLKLRRQADSIDLVVEGAGTSPQLRQAATADGWIGDLRISASTSLRFGNQRFTAPELGFQSVIFEGSGTSYRLSVMPVRVRIHSSLVSTIFSRSKLVSLSSGTHPLTAVIAAVNVCIMFF